MLHSVISFSVGITFLLSVIGNVGYTQKLPLLLKAKDHITQIPEPAKCVKILPQVALIPPSIDYSHLEALLKAKKWQAADLETLNLMLKARNRNIDELLSNQDIANFSCQILSRVDRLWQKYSDGRFGFSVQVEIDENKCSEYSDFYPVAYGCLGQEVGWLKNDQWINYSQVKFDISAPPGHLPAVYLLLLERAEGQCPQDEEFLRSEREITAKERDCLGTQLMLVYGGPLSLVYSPECQIELSDDPLGSPQKNAVVYYNRGNNRYELGNYQGAIEDYTQAITLNPNLDNAYYNRGNAYLELNNDQQAIADYSQAIKINPRMPQAYYNRGNIYHKLGQHDQAIDDYTQAIRTNQYYAHENRRLLSAYTYYNRALSYKQLGRKQQAIRDFQAAADIHQELGNDDRYRRAINQIRRLR